MNGFGEKEEDQRPIYPDFKSFNDTIDGRVPSCVVKDWLHFQTILNEDLDQANGNEKVWRGHRRYDWQLDSKLTRQFDGGSIDPQVQNQLKHRFLLAMRGRGIDLSGKEDNEIWAYGQHFGLSTPLLDWTQAPFVALFFAFIDDHPEAEDPNPYRAVFRLNRSLIEDILPNLFFEPALGENVRLVNQAGLFTVTPGGEDNLVTEILNELGASGAVDMGDDCDIARYVCKFHVPAVKRIECLAMLRQTNIHHGSLFPDPGGASLFCNDWLSRSIAENKLLAAEKEKTAATQRTKPRLELADIVNSDIDIVSKIKVIVADALNPETLADGELFAWSMKIDAAYNEHASIDWTKHQSGVAAIRIAFRRLLQLLGCPASRREAVEDALVAFYRTLYDGKGTA